MSSTRDGKEKSIFKNEDIIFRLFSCHNLLHQKNSNLTFAILHNIVHSTI